MEPEDWEGRGREVGAWKSKDLVWDLAWDLVWSQELLRSCYSEDRQVRRQETLPFYLPPWCSKV